ncbi:YfbM family protein [Nocardia sp. NPDC003979]
MGAVMSFRRVSTAELEMAMRHKDIAEEFLAGYEPSADDPSGYLDKAWGGLNYLLEAAGTGVDLFFTPTPLPIGEYNGWTAEEVARTAETLSKTPFSKLAEHYNGVRMVEAQVYPNIWGDTRNDGLGYLREYYTKLVAVFQHAAEHDAGLLQHFG